MSRLGMIVALVVLPLLALAPARGAAGPSTSSPGAARAGPAPAAADATAAARTDAPAADAPTDTAWSSAALTVAPDGAPAALAALAGGPHLHAATAVLIEASGGLRLAGRGADVARPMASTTKLMTALLVLEREPLQRILTAPGYAGSSAESVMGLEAGERMSVADLLTGMLLPSANDAAQALAIRAASSLPAFVRSMNERAAALGLRHTHYGSPVGLDDGLTHSSAADLARLAAIDLRIPFFGHTVRRRSAQVGIGARRRTVLNRNTLLGRASWVNGVKTGYTISAGNVLVGSGTVNGVTLISVVMGEGDEATRDQDSLALLRFGFSRVRRVEVVRPGVVYARVPVPGAPAPAELEAQAPLAPIVIRGLAIQRRVLVTRRLRGPLPAGARVGELLVRSGGRELGRVPLRLRRALPAPTGLAAALDGAGGAAGAGLGTAALAVGTILLVRRRRQNRGQEPRTRPVRRLA